MANNPYVNKVQKADGTTIIDISDTTATASEILQGYGAYGADGAWMDGTATGGSSGVVYITDEEDEHGGIVRHLTTDGATITDTTDAHGGTVRSITGEEVYLQVKHVTPSSTQQTIEPDQGYAALAKVIVNAASGGDASPIVGIGKVGSMII